MSRSDLTYMGFHRRKRLRQRRRPCLGRRSEGRITCGGCHYAGRRGFRPCYSIGSYKCGECSRSHSPSSPFTGASQLSLALCFHSNASGRRRSRRSRWSYN